jgi:hypothetical protein
MPRLGCTLHAFKQKKGDSANRYRLEWLASKRVVNLCSPKIRQALAGEPLHCLTPLPPGGIRCRGVKEQGHLPLSVAFAAISLSLTLLVRQLASRGHNKPECSNSYCLWMHTNHGVRGASDERAERLYVRIPGRHLSSCYPITVVQYPFIAEGDTADKVQHSRVQSNIMFPYPLRCQPARLYVRVPRP